MLTYIKSSIPILIILAALMGCTLFQKKVPQELFPVDSPISTEPTTVDGSIDASHRPERNPSEGSSTSQIDWQLEFRGDPGIHLQNHTTHLPAEKHVFTATFTQEMNQASVEKAFQENLINNDFPDKSEFVPTLDFKWLNPLQVEITFNGADLITHTYRYTLSAQGAFNKDGSLQLTVEKFLSFDIYPIKTLYGIDRYGKVSKPTVKIPYSLFPLSQSPDGQQIILGRANYLETDAGYLQYLFDIPSKKIKKILNAYPFWGNDQKLYSLTENSLVRLGDDEEQWVEFGEYPYIHGWSISPDLNYEIYLLSKDLVPDQTNISIMVKDLITNQTETYGDLVPMNDLNSINGEISHFKIQWINSNKHIFLETYSDDGDQIYYIFDLESRQLSEAPEFLQVANSTAPSWSMDQKYVAIPPNEKQGGIFDTNGNLVYEWNPLYIPGSALYWHPNKHIVAYKTITTDSYYIVQYDLDLGEITLTEGDYTILGWTANGATLQVSK